MKPATDQAARRIVKLTLAVLLIELFVLLLRSWLQTVLASDGMSAAVAKDLSYLIVPPLLLLLLMPLANDVLPAFRGRFRWRQLTVRTVVVALGLGVAVRLATWGVLIAAVSFRLVANDDPGAIPGPLIDWNCPPPYVAALNLLVMALLTPFVEEVINRGLFLTWLLRFGRPCAVLASSLLFALAHRPGSMGSALVFGLLVGVLYLNTGSLWGPVLAHGTANALVLLDWQCLNAVWNPAEVTNALRAVGALAAVLAASSFALACLLVSKRVAGEEPPGDPPTGH